jgi:broad specificity phosphatase PhoE
MMRLLLIRHAETESNVIRAMDTQPPGPGLTHQGQRQAERLPATLKDEPIDAIYASTLVRTSLTATPLAAARSLPIVIVNDLREIPAGSLEMQNDDQSVGTYLATLDRWVAGDLGARMPGSENGHEFLARYDAAIGQIAEKGHSAAVAFSHGGSIRTWAAIRAVNVDPQVDLRYDLDNVAMLALEGSPGSWFLEF